MTISAAVPTIWFSLLQHLEASGDRLPDLQRVVIGGSACPRAVTKTFRDVYGVEVVHAWGYDRDESARLGLHAQA